MNSTKYSVGIMSLVGLCLLLVTRSASPADYLTLRHVPNLIQNAVPVAPEPHLALIGFEPEMGSHITAIGSRTKNDDDAARDNRVVGWLAQAVPKCRITCLLIGEEIATGEAIRQAVDGGATVIYVPWNEIDFGCALQQDSIALAWERGALLLTIVPRRANSANCPVGVLPINLLDIPAIELQTAEPGSASFEVYLLAELLRDPPAELEGVSEEILAAVYVTAVAVAIPADGVSAHLERVAKLTLSTPAIRVEKDHKAVRLIEAQAALADKAAQLWLAGKPVNWDHQFSDLPKSFYVYQASAPGKETLRVRAAVEGNTPVRWLLAVSILTHSRPLSVFPHGTGMTLFEFETNNATSLLVQLLKAQPAAESGGFCSTIVAFPSGK